jgi:hypothetical protein
VGGGTADLTATQVALAKQLGLNPVAAPGLHAEMTVIQGASERGLTPMYGASTNIICPACSVYITQDLGGAVTGARSYRFPP